MIDRSDCLPGNHPRDRLCSRRPPACATPLAFAHICAPEVGMTPKIQKTRYSARLLSVFLFSLPYTFRIAFCIGAKGHFLKIIFAF
jgi:hypothetical protein